MKNIRIGLFGVLHRRDQDIDSLEKRLNEKDISDVKEWVDRRIVRRKTIQCNSYALKHTCEREIGRYVTNGELIKAMIEKGYTGEVRGPNVLFYCDRTKI